MCGIAGIIAFSPTVRIEKVMLERMADAIRHRGPDGDGFYLDQGVGLVHRRLRRSRSWIPTHVQRGRNDLDFQRDSMTSPPQTWVP